MQRHEFICYAQRMLNPFRGAMHTVRMEWADAVTTDGLNWTLYVRGERFYDDLSAEGDGNISVPDIKYGQWSADSGFVRAPIRLPTLEVVVRDEGERLLRAVRQAAPHLPFSYVDDRELWLLHRSSGRPLALLASRCAHESTQLPPLLRWTPGQIAVAHDPDLGLLAQEIAGLAGKDPAVGWFARNDERLPDAELDFAALADGVQARRRLMAWQAPYRLLLELDDTARTDTERLACRHPRRMLEQLALYPKIIQIPLVVAARVELRMREAAAAGAPESDPGSQDVLSPDYLELGD